MWCGKLRIGKGYILSDIPPRHLPGIHLQEPWRRESGLGNLESPFSLAVLLFHKDFRPRKARSANHPQRSRLKVAQGNLLFAEAIGSEGFGHDSTRQMKESNCQLSLLKAHHGVTPVPSARIGAAILAVTGYAETPRPSLTCFPPEPVDNNGRCGNQSKRKGLFLWRGCFPERRGLRGQQSAWRALGGIHTRPC